MSEQNKSPKETKSAEKEPTQASAQKQAEKPAANPVAAKTKSPEEGAAAKTVRKAVKKTRSSAKKTTAKKTAGNVKKAPAKKTAGAKAKTSRQKTARTRKAANQQTTQRMENVMTQGKTQFDKLAQDTAKAGKEQADAFIQAGNVFVKGLEDITKTYINLAQTSAEKNSQAVKTLLGCKTINEYTEAQNKLVQQNFDDFMAGTTRLSELSIKLATDALEPINDQLSKTLKKAGAA